MRLNLKSRDDFAALHLHEKNQYIQDAARQVAQACDDEFLPLDKDVEPHPTLL
jgi:hypothetical protein